MATIKNTKPGYDYAEVMVSDYETAKPNETASGYKLHLDFIKMERLGIGCEILSDNTGINLFLLDAPGGIDLAKVGYAVAETLEAQGVLYGRAATLAEVACDAIEKRELTERILSMLD